MRGLDWYLSRSRLRSGTARAYSRRARSDAPLSVSSGMEGIVSGEGVSVLHALQLELRGRRSGGVRVAADHFVEGLAGHAEVSGFFEGEPDFEHRVGGLVLFGILLRHAFVRTHRVREIGGGVIRLADPVERVVGEIAGGIGIEDLLECGPRVGHASFAEE